MCGIAGKITGGRPVPRPLIGAMCDRMLHRGPDAEGLFVDGHVALGMRRLAIIDLDHGDQPIRSEDGSLVLVLNGEIYNHVELREELRARGHVFAGGSDAEVVVHLWEDHGPACLSRLRGMFAFALWDTRSEELFLVRDRVGKKPLAWAEVDGGIAFASEIEALLADPAVSRDVDPVALDAFLVNQYVPGHRCAFRHVHKLPPAGILRWRAGRRPRIERWWHLEYSPKVDIDPRDAEALVREQLLDATRIRLRSDVPLGAFLSGGLDSAAVVAAMSRCASGPVRTFSVRFGERDYDETPWARAVAQHCGTDHHELEVGAVDAAELGFLQRRFGEPFADPAALPTLLLSRLTGEHVTVVLSGDGGDEAFAGYRRYRQLAMTRGADRLPSGLRARAAAALARIASGTEGREMLPRAARLAARLAMDPAHRYADLFRYLTDAQRGTLYGPALREAVEAADPLAHVAGAWDSRDGLGDVDRLMAVDLDTYLPDDLLAKVDVTSMAASLEVRSPLLDHQLLEIAALLPEDLKHDKRVLRDAVRPWLPGEVVDRRKHGFAVPVGDWLRDELRTLPEDVLLDPSSLARGLFDPHAVRRFVAEHHAGRDHGKQLWAMVAVELWHRELVDPSAMADAAVAA